MPRYQLTKRGKEKARVPTAKRDLLVDSLYNDGKPTSASYEELAQEVGRQELPVLLSRDTRQGLVEEVGSGVF